MIDAKTAAKELVEKYKPLVTTWDCYWDAPVPEEEILKDAKACAIIAVQLVIDNSPFDPHSGSWYEIPSDRVDDAIEYWKQVKAAIESM